MSRRGDWMPRRGELVGEALVAATASGAAVLVATHDSEFVARFATRVLTMDAGRVLETTAVTS